VVIRNLNPAKQISAYVDNIALKYISQNTDSFANKLIKVK